MSVDDFIAAREKKEEWIGIKLLISWMAILAVCWYGVYRLTAWLWEKL